MQVTQSLGVPRAYVRMLCELEDFLNKTLAGALAGALVVRPSHRCCRRVEPLFLPCSLGMPSLRLLCPPGLAYMQRSQS